MVLHFVTGGFSGATQVAIDICRDTTPGWRQVLVLRLKMATDLDRITALRASGLEVAVVPGWSRWVGMLALARLCRRLDAQVLLAHGFPEHLLGRIAGRLAGVPHLIQVEHNSRERYGPVSRWLVQRLAPGTDRFIGVSEGVREGLLRMGTPAARTLAIPNGIALGPFAKAAAQQPLAQRADGLVMAARFSRQKDHACLLHALHLLAQRGWRPPVLLAGGGKARDMARARALCTELGLDGHVTFAGKVADLPQRLLATRIGVLASHYEGMPLALIECMAAGMAVVASAVVGSQELIEHGRTGLLVPPSDPQALANALERLLSNPDFAQTLATAARQQAVTAHSDQLTRARYRAVITDLLQPSLPLPPTAP